MKSKLFVMVLMLVVNCSIALARGTACENYCAALYAEQLALCNQLYGPNAENPNPVLLEKCKTAIANNYDRCMNNCAGE